MAQSWKKFNIAACLSLVVICVVGCSIDGKHCDIWLILIAEESRHSLLALFFLRNSFLRNILGETGNLISIVVLLTINDESAFLEFENQATAIMTKHGGELVSAFRPSLADSSVDAKDVDEVHVLQFPDQASFTSYRADSRLAALSALRVKAIKTSRVYVSGKAIEYPLSPANQATSKQLPNTLPKTVRSQRHSKL